MCLLGTVRLFGTPEYMRVKIKTNENILSFQTTGLHLLNDGKIQILILHGAKDIKIFLFSQSLNCTVFKLQGK